MLRVDRTKPRKTRCFVQYLEDAVEEWIDFATHSFRDLQISAAGIAAKSGADVAAAIEAAKRKRGRRDDRRRGPAASPSKRDLLGATDHTAATEAATIVAAIADAARQTEIRAQRQKLFTSQYNQMGKVVDFLLREDRYGYFSSSVNTIEWSDYIPKLEERLGIATLMDLSLIRERWQDNYYTRDAYATSLDADASSAAAAAAASAVVSSAEAIPQCPWRVGMDVFATTAKTKSAAAGVFYPARVIKVDQMRRAQSVGWVKVHYRGFKKGADEWLAPSHLSLEEPMESDSGSAEEDEDEERAMAQEGPAAGGDEEAPGGGPAADPPVRSVDWSNLLRDFNAIIANALAYWPPPHDVLGSVPFEALRLQVRLSFFVCLYFFCLLIYFFCLLFISFVCAPCRSLR